MNRFSLREMLVLLVISSVALTFTQFHVLYGAAALIVVLIVSGFFLNPNNWRCLAYGAVIGIIISHTIMHLLGSWATVVSSSRDQFPRDLNFFFSYRPYVIPLGALFGGTTALALLGKRDESKS